MHGLLLGVARKGVALVPWLTPAHLLRVIRLSVLMYCQIIVGSGFLKKHGQLADGVVPQTSRFGRLGERVTLAVKLHAFELPSLRQQALDKAGHELIRQPALLKHLIDRVLDAVLDYLLEGVAFKNNACLRAVD